MQPDASKSIRVLLGESVWEDAEATISGGNLWIEFESEDLDSICIPLNTEQDLEEFFKGILADTSRKES